MKYRRSKEIKSIMKVYRDRTAQVIWAARKISPVLAKQVRDLENYNIHSVYEGIHNELAGRSKNVGLSNFLDS